MCDCHKECSRRSGGETNPATDRSSQRLLPDFEGADGAKKCHGARCVRMAIAGSLTEVGRATPELEEGADEGAAATGTTQSEAAGYRPGSGCYRRSRNGVSRFRVPLQPLQVGAQLGGALIAETPILLQSLEDDVFELGG